MLVIRCTQKLFRHTRGNADAVADDTTTLGEWYANLIPVGRRKRTLLVNAATRLAVIVPSGPLEKVVREFRDRLAALLDAIGVHEDDIDREVEAAAEFATARATDRSVLGTMNLLGRDLPHFYDIAVQAGEEPEFACEWRFAHEMHSPLGYRAPAELVREAFAEEKPYVPPDEIAREHLIVEGVMPHEWEFRYHRIDPEVNEQLLFALEVHRRYHTAEARTMLASLIRDYPEFIDAYHHLAAMMRHPERHEAALDLWNRAVEIGLAALPHRFRVGTDRLRWGFLYNRPFLRACHGLALAYDRIGALKKAGRMYHDLLEYNPDDNQGVRALYVNLLLRLDDSEGALEVCRRFPDDTMVDILYGRVLALLRLARDSDARAALALAVDARPLVALELTTTRRRPKPRGHRADRDDHILDTREEAYAHWVDCVELWDSTPGALDFVREYVEENPNAMTRPVDNVIPFPKGDRE